MPFIPPPPGPPVLLVQEGDTALSAVFYTYGLPACGKTTFTLARIAEDSTIVRVNNDDLGRAIFTGRSKQNGVLLANVRATILRLAIEQGRTVIVDNTNLSPRSRREILDAASRGWRRVFKVDFTHVPLEECIRRDALRPDPERVGSVVINSMFEQFLAEEAT